MANLLEQLAAAQTGSSSSAADAGTSGSGNTLQRLAAAQTTGGVINDINSFYDNLNKYNTESTELFSSFGKRMGASAYDKSYANWANRARSTSNDLSSRYEQLKGYFDTHRDEFSPDAVSELEDYFNAHSGLYGDISKGLDDYTDYWNKYASEYVVTGADGQQYDKFADGDYDRYVQSFVDSEAQAKQDYEDAKDDGGILNWLFSFVNQSDVNTGDKQATQINIRESREALNAATSARMQAEKDRDEWAAGTQALDDQAAAIRWITEQQAQGFTVEEAYLKAKDRLDTARGEYNKAQDKIQDSMAYGTDIYGGTGEAMSVFAAENDIEEKAKEYSDAEREFEYAQFIGRYAEAPITEGMPGYDADVMATGISKATEMMDELLEKRDESIGEIYVDNSDSLQYNAAKNMILEEGAVTDNEFKTWIYLLGSGKQVEADAYAIEINNKYARAKRNEKQQQAMEWVAADLGDTDFAQARENARKVLASVAATVTPLVTSPFEMATNIGEYAVTGQISEKPTLSYAVVSRCDRVCE